MLKALLLLMLIAPAGAEFREISADQMDASRLSEFGREALQMPGIKWQHAQTGRFVYHFERKTFALKVARMAEFLFDHIADGLKMSPAAPEGRSHIFIFRSQEDWRQFIAAGGMKEEWAFSIVRGPEMFLQQADGTSESGGVLAHEMTHLAVNRLFPRGLPLWLNEGLAEWYGEFGYAAFKGIKKSRRQHFKASGPLYPLQMLFAAEEYPPAVDVFYFTSKMLAGFMMLELPAEEFLPFVQDLMDGMPAEECFRMHYGIESADALQKKLEAFLK